MDVRLAIGICCAISALPSFAKYYAFFPYPYFEISTKKAPIFSWMLAFILFDDISIAGFNVLVVVTFRVQNSEGFTAIGKSLRLGTAARIASFENASSVTLTGTAPQMNGIIVLAATGANEFDVFFVRTHQVSSWASNGTKITQSIADDGADNYTLNINLASSYAHGIMLLGGSISHCDVAIKY